MRQHAIVIDPALLGSGGLDLPGPLCAARPRQAVVVCTGPTSVAQRVRGLRLGADDWVTKPCHPEEVLARVEAALRARQAGAPPDPPSRGRRRARDPADMFEAFVGGRARRPDAARVRAAAAAGRLAAG